MRSILYSKDDVEIYVRRCDFVHASFNGVQRGYA